MINTTETKPRRMVAEIQVTRKDGTKEPSRVVGYYHRNPLKRLWFKFTGVAL